MLQTTRHKHNSEHFPKTFTELLLLLLCFLEITFRFLDDVVYLCQLYLCLSLNLYLSLPRHQ